MSKLLFQGARFPGDIRVEDRRIVEIAPANTLVQLPDEQVISCSDAVITAGLVNTHHHLYQWMTRGWASGCDLFNWLTTLYPVWGELSVEDVHAAALVGLSELALTGCTTAADHHYLVPRGDDSVFDAIAQAARQVGIRIYLSRGSMDLSQKDGGLPPDHVVEDRESILISTERVIAELHDGDMVNVVVAPCSPFSVTQELMVESAELARRHGLRLHTHLAETMDENEHCLERFGARPLQVLDEWGWTGSDVWVAHGIWFDDSEVARMGATHTGVAHCPSSNARLAAGMCRVTDLRAAGAPVGLGVDGVASNEIGGLFPELRQSLFVARLRELDATAFDHLDALEIGSAGGAACVGRTDFGRLEVGQRADFAVWETPDLMDVCDPLVGLVFGPERRVSRLVVGGTSVVQGGTLVGVDLTAARLDLARRARRLWPMGAHR